MSVKLGTNPFSASPELDIIETPDDERDLEHDDKLGDLTHPADATDDPYHPENFDLESFDPVVSNYTSTGKFRQQQTQANKLKGVFKEKVLTQVFNGEAELVENYNYDTPEWDRPKSAPSILPSHLVLMFTEIDDSKTWIGTLIDPHNKTVIAGHILQVYPVLASKVKEDGSNFIPLWDDDAIERMKTHAKEHHDKIHNAFIDPSNDDEDGDFEDGEQGWEHPRKRFNMTKRASNKMSPSKGGSN